MGRHDYGFGAQSNITLVLSAKTPGSGGFDVVVSIFRLLNHQTPFEYLMRLLINFVFNIRKSLTPSPTGQHIRTIESSDPLNLYLKINVFNICNDC